MNTISAIIPVYNGRAFIRSTMESVWNQTLPPSEIVLVDDGSVDGSIQLLQELAEESPIPCTIFQQANKGPASSRNLAVRHSTGSIIAFLDQDDIWHPEYLATQVQRISLTPYESYSICHFNYFVDAGYLQRHGEIPAWVRPEFLTRPQPGYLPSCMVMYKDVFLKVGNFDESLRSGYDTDWIVRAIDSGVELDINTEVLVDRRIHSENQTSNVAALHKDAIRMVHKMILRRRALSTDSNPQNQ